MRQVSLAQIPEGRGPGIFLSPALALPGPHARLWDLSTFLLSLRVVVCVGLCFRFDRACIRLL